MTKRHVCDSPLCKFVTSTECDLFTSHDGKKLCRLCYCEEVQPGMNDTDFKFISYPDELEVVPDSPPVGGLFE